MDPRLIVLKLVLEGLNVPTDGSADCGMVFEAIHQAQLDGVDLGYHFRRYPCLYCLSLVHDYSEMVRAVQIGDQEHEKFILEDPVATALRSSAVRRNQIGSEYKGAQA